MILISKRIGVLMERYPTFSGLAGLEASEMYVKENEELKNVKIEGLVCQHNIQADTTLVFKLKSKQVWLQVEMHLEGQEDYFNVSFEIRIDLTLSLREVKNVLLKTAIHLWSRVSQNENSQYSFFYLLKNFTLEDVESTKVECNTEHFDTSLGLNRDESLFSPHFQH